MNIQPITNIKSQIFTGKVAQNNYVTKPMKQDSFEVSDKAFDLDKSMKTLSNIRLENGKKKFEQNQLSKIEKSLVKEPQKWDSVYKLAQNPNIKGNFVYLMALKPLEHLNTLVQVAETKNEKGNYKYSGKEMMQFTDKLMPDELQKSLPLTKTKLSVKNIVLLTQTPNVPDLGKVADKVLEMEKVAGKDLQEVSFTQNKYIKNSYVVSAKLQGDDEKKEVLNKDLKRESIEDRTSYVNSNGKKYFVRKSTDLRNNTISKVTLREDKAVGVPVFENEVRIVKDKNNKVKYYEYTSHSQVNGVYDIVRKTPEGKQKILSLGKIDKKTGIISIKKDMTSPEGVRTQYLYENDPQGNRIVGEELIKLGETIDFLETINDSLDSFYNGGCRSITTGPDEFLFLHELGHARDYRDVDSVTTSDAESMKNAINNDKEVNKIFEEEKAAFFKAYPDTQREHVDYFMNILDHCGGESGGLCETIAESNALLSEGKSYEPLAIRSQYLQQNFPRTIAILESKLSK